VSTDNVRVLHCALPACADGLCSAAPEPARVFRVRLEYVPDSTPPLWSAIQHWRRLAVFNVNDFDGYTHISRRFYQNERGQRIGVNVNQLAASVRADGMVFCPRGALCVNRRARVMLMQAVHGQGEYDNWGVDDMRIQAQGGIASDTEIVASSPPAKTAIPLTDAQDRSWRDAGRLTGKWLKGVPIRIAINNQTYERAGYANFCKSPGDSKPNPRNPRETIACPEAYFNWDEPDWLFQSAVQKKYTNWYEKTIEREWSENNRVFRSQTSEQFQYYQHPRVGNIKPSGGPLDGGTAVTVIGEGFSVFSDPIRTPRCKFGTMVVPAKVVEDTSIECRTPASLYAGYVDVVVSLNEVDFTSAQLGAQYAAPFLYFRPPVVERLWPYTGPNRGGTVINIVGSGFFQLPSPPACRFIGVNDPTVRPLPSLLLPLPMSLLYTPYCCPYMGRAAPSVLHARARARWADPGTVFPRFDRPG